MASFSLHKKITFTVFAEKSSESPNTYWVSVWSLWIMRFHSPNARTLKKSYVLSHLTKEKGLQKVSGFWRWKIRSSFVPQDHRKFDATRYLDETRYVFPFFSNPARRHWTLARSKIPFWARRASDKLTNAQSCRKLRTAHLHWQWFCFLRRNKKSISGVLIFFRTLLMYWRSGKQNHVSRSTTEAEFYALLEGITEVEFRQDFIYFPYKFDTRILNCKNTPILCDNSSAWKIASSIESIARTKHIDVAHLWIQQEVAKERIKVHYVNTEDQAADIFTKSLGWELCEKLKQRLGMISSKNMWPIISFFCLTHSKSVRIWIFNIARSKSQRRIFERPHVLRLSIRSQNLIL